MKKVEIRVLSMGSTPTWVGLVRRTHQDYRSGPLSEEQWEVIEVFYLRE